MSSPNVQIFGTRKDPDTRKALRFFSERRIKAHFVNLKERPASKGELRRFAQKFGTVALVDRSSRRFRDRGLQHATYSDESWLAKLEEEPLMLRTPLVRSGNRFSIGLAEAEWKEWLSE